MFPTFFFFFFPFSVKHSRSVFLPFYLMGRIKKDGHSCSPLVKCRSSGLRVSTAAGSTAAMLSAGGFAMPILSKDLQYMVREPISPGADTSNFMHGVIKSGESVDTTWFCKEGQIYIDGSQNVRSIQYGDTIELSSEAPILKLFLPPHLLSYNPRL